MSKWFNLIKKAVIVLELIADLFLKDESQPSQLSRNDIKAKGTEAKR